MSKRITVVALLMIAFVALGVGALAWLRDAGNLPIYTVRDYDWGQTVMQFGTKTWAEVERERDAKADITTPEQLQELEGDAAMPKPSEGEAAAESSDAPGEDAERRVPQAQLLDGDDAERALKGDFFVLYYVLRE